MKIVAIAGTFDSKGREFAYIRDLIEGQGLKTLTIHTGVFAPAFVPDISNEEVAAEVGEDISAIARKGDRALATDVLSRGMTSIIPRLYHEGRFDGIISLGGSGGTALVTPGMRALPIGVPKLMVSTMVGGNISGYVGTSDIIMMPSVVDVAGLNSISTKIFTNAAFAIAGMVKFENDNVLEKKPLVAATMFGVTTPCLNEAQRVLEENGYEVLIFHATGTGGKSMEALINAGFIEGVLDITTTEWADELVGGILAGGQHRLEAAGKAGLPQVVSTGALDMVNFGPIESVPASFKNRKLYKHNPMITLMRTTKDENKAIAHEIAVRLNEAAGQTVLMLPLKGVSGIDAPEQPFYDPEVDTALFEALESECNSNTVEIEKLNLHINDKAFAKAAAEKLMQMMEQKSDQ